MRVVLVVGILLLVPIPPSTGDAPPGAPQNLVATFDPAAATIELEWTAPSSSSSVSYTYSIYRGTTYLGDTTDLTFTDTSPPLTIAAYTVTTKVEGLESTPVLLVVPTAAACAPSIVQSRFNNYLITPQTPCTAAQCLPSGPGDAVNRAIAAAPCTLTPCAPIVIWILPPDVLIHEECLPTTSGGSTTYEFQVLS